MQETLSDAQFRRQVAITNNSDEPTHFDSSSSDEEDLPNMEMIAQEASIESQSCLEGPESDDNEEINQSETSSLTNENVTTSEHGENSATSDLESLSEQVGILKSLEFKS